MIVSWLRATGRDLAQLDPSGTADLRPIAPRATFLAGASKLPTSWADGGRTLLVRQYGGAERQPAIWAVALDGSREPRPVVPSATHAHISNDGRWIAYTAQDSTTARSEVYVARFPAGRPEWKVSTSGGGLPVWSRSGRELFYRYRDGVFAVPVTLGQTFTSGTPESCLRSPLTKAIPGLQTTTSRPTTSVFSWCSLATPEGQIGLT